MFPRVGVYLHYIPNYEFSSVLDSDLLIPGRALNKGFTVAGIVDFRCIKG